AARRDRSQGRRTNRDGELRGVGRPCREGRGSPRGPSASPTRRRPGGDLSALLPGGSGVNWPTAILALRLRLPSTVSAAIGLIAVMAAVGALFPAVGHTIGKINVPHGVSNLLGGADYGTITGWFRGEIAAIYGPLVIGALAINGASAVTAGEEEDGILAVVLAHPIRRSRLIASKATAIG